MGFYKGDLMSMSRRAAAEFLGTFWLALRDDQRGRAGAANSANQF